MKKAIITGLIVIVVIAGLIFLFRKPASSPTPGGTGALPTSTPPVTTVPTSTPSGTMLTIGTTQGSVQVNNFYKNPVQITPDRTSVLINDTPSYDISYYAPDSSFIVSILAQPVPTVEAQAETAFLTQLGVSKADACKLKVIVSVPISVDQNYAGQNLGLSFCGGPFGQ